MNDKVHHVMSSRQFRDHECHWPGCTVQVPPAMWGCKYHWYKLPKRLRDDIWRTYQIGQEETLTPSRAYVEVARKVQVWIKQAIETGWLKEEKQPWPSEKRQSPS
ncbi:MAG: hypothetical protein KGJ13_09740 [Patescibacteria group bacterium]|nr:hypothetical protein [Patescibacteria group bacterium]